MMRLFFLFSLITFVSCSSSGGFGTYLDTNQLAVDSTNNRLFISQPEGELFALLASTRASISSQPIVDADTNASISALLPSIISDMAIFSNGSASRLFLLGAFPDDSGNLVFNRVRVLDFDGVSFSQPAFSPIVLSDGDDATDETINSFPNILVDATNSRIYVLDTDAGLLYVMSTTDGSEVTAPIAIAGNPLGLSLDNDQLYVGNVSTVEAEQVVTVVNVTDFSMTAIDLDIPCNQIAAASNGSGTVLLAKNSSNGQVLIRLVDTATYASSTAIASTTDGFSTGVLVSGAGVSSTINGMLLKQASDGIVYGYLSERDGNIEFISFSADLSSYAVQTLATSATDIGPGALLTSSSDTGNTAFFVANSGYLVTIAFGSAEADLDN